MLVAEVQTRAPQSACVGPSKITSTLLSLCRNEVWPEIAVCFIFSGF